jgi:bifunctional non-homologous end joining protein LigD
MQLACRASYPPFMGKHGEKVVLEVSGHEVTVTNPSKIYFPEAGITKLEVVQYYLAVAEGALRGAGGRPNVLVRYADGIHGEFFYQKRAPEKRPDWIEVAEIRFPSGRTAEEVVPRDAASLAWIANLGCLELHPHPVRTSDLEHPDELRVDLDPMPGIEWKQIVEVARVVQQLLGELGLVGWPKTSGSRGVHVNVRIHPRWSFSQVRRAALALAREVERRAPKLATSKWWKEERHGVFLDYNQNAKDRTVASAYSVRPKPDARVSAPLTWDELVASEPGAFTLRTMPARFAAIGDRHERMNDSPGSLDALLELSARQETEGLGDAPWPPHYMKQADEPPRVQPSKRRAGPSPTGRRTSTKPLLEIARARTKADALAGLERWKARHPDAAARLEQADVLVDSMRGRSSTWTRVRVNLEHVPEELRPPQEPLDPDYDPWGGFRPPSEKAERTAPKR